jgi:hypothetical protein
VGQLSTFCIPAGSQVLQRVSCNECRHYQVCLTFFNNRATQDDIHTKTDSTVNGIDAWARRGIAGRGVLVDYHSWALKNNVEYDRLGAHGVTLDEVKAILKESNIQLCQGDIFILRTGMAHSPTQHEWTLEAKRPQDLSMRTRSSIRKLEKTFQPSTVSQASLSPKKLQSGSGNSSLPPLRETTRGSNVFVSRLIKP